MDSLTPPADPFLSLTGPQRTKLTAVLLLGRFDNGAPVNFHTLAQALGTSPQALLAYQANLRETLALIGKEAAGRLLGAGQLGQLQGLTGLQQLNDWAARAVEGWEMARTQQTPLEQLVAAGQGGDGQPPSPLVQVVQALEANGASVPASVSTPNFDAMLDFARLGVDVAKTIALGTGELSPAPPKGSGITIGVQVNQPAPQTVWPRTGPVIEGTGAGDEVVTIEQ